MITLGSSAYVREKDSVWFSNVGFNGLFTMNLQNGQVEFVDRFKEVSLGNIKTHLTAYKIKDEMVFIPCFSNRISIYNILTRQQYTIEIPGVLGKNEVSALTYRAGDVIWIFSLTNLGVVWSLDVGKKTLEQDVMLSCIWDQFMNGEITAVRTYSDQDKFILCKIEQQQICEIDKKTKQAENFEIHLPSGKLSKVARDGNFYWILLEDSHDIYRWNKEKDEYVRYEATEREWYGKTEILPYGGIVFSEEEIFLVNYYAKNVMRVNVEKQIIEKAFDYPEQFRITGELKWGAVFSGAEIYKDELWLFPQKGNMVIRYDLKTYSVDGFEIKIPENKIPYIEKILRECQESDGYILETGNVFALTRFINQIDDF